MKIFGYECKRLLWNKFFIGISVVLLFYRHQVPSRKTLDEPLYEAITDSDFELFPEDSQ